ncbi:23S ribosomal RNA methyltransferase Erm [Microbacterium sp. dk485]|uniref:23S ribosomal RNA methyltransferase Erm n=1 Tax=Microbacterium sp. dk485 TaxID=2560021 RepID=UPI001073792C|nr:23S ribosomal RNA methyltransferase Erm [Microbacterium sp. dk485]TFV82531.1 23S ribosomal RNA methyltransferase Erm [Microbacterium sp. dk485]
MPMHSPYGGRAELGQNFLRDPRAIARAIDLVRSTPGPILEIGAGDGALTLPLSRLARPLRAIEIDPVRAQALRRRAPHIDVVAADGLAVPLDRPTVVSNVPFHLTTPLLRRLLHSGTWTHAVLVLQWEVARKRAGVGGRTMMTAQTDPWFSFSLEGRIPSHAFSPRPGVDAGLLRIQRRATPLVPLAERGSYAAFVRRVFTGRGGTLARLVARAAPGSSAAAVADALARAGVAPSALPRDVRPVQWAEIWRATRPTAVDRRQR